MLRQWSFPSYTVVSAVFSLLSLAWSIMTLEKEGLLTEEKKSWKLIHGYVFFSWQLSTIISRLFSIALFAYVFRYYVIIFLAIHCLILVVTIFHREKSDGRCWGKSLLLSLPFACSSLFHSAKTVLPIEDPTSYNMRVGYISLILSTIIMVILSLAIEMPNVPPMNLIQPTAIVSVAGVLPLSLCFYCLVKKDSGGMSKESIKLL